MTSSKVPRLLQQQPGREDEDAQWRAQQQQGGGWERRSATGGQWPASSAGGATRQPGEEPHPQPPETHHAPHHPPHKGDLPDPTESPKPSKEREVGDLEKSEREGHGRAL